MNIFGLPIPDGRLVKKLCCLPKLQMGKRYDNREYRQHGIKKVLADSLYCSADEIVLDNIYYVKKQSKANSVFSL